MTEDKESTLCREHIDSCACHLCNCMSPDTTGIDYEAAAKHFLLFLDGIEYLDTDNSFTLLDNSCNLMVSKDICAMETCIKNIGHCKSEWIHSSVRHLYSTYKTLVNRRFHSDCLLRINCLSIDSGTKTSINKG